MCVARIRFIFLALCLLLPATLVKPQTDGSLNSSIETIADGEPSDDLGPDFSLPSVTGLAQDLSGNVFFSIQAQNRVYRLAPSGRVTIFAGNGVRARNSEGVAAVASPLFSPYALTTDKVGNVYIVCLRSLVRVDAVTGTIHTVFDVPYKQIGSSASISSINGMTIGPHGDLYFSDGGDFCIKSYSLASGLVTVLAGNGTRGPTQSGGPATSSPLKYPQAVAVALDGTVYFTTLEPFVFFITPRDGILHQLSVRLPDQNNPPGDYEIPHAIALDGKGSLYAAQTNRSRVLRINTGTEDVSVFAGAASQGVSGEGVPASDATMTVPSQLVSDAAGNVTIAEQHRIRSVSASNLLIATLVGNGSSVADETSAAVGAATLWEPANAMPAPDGSLYITSSFSHRLVRLDRFGGLATVAGGGEYTRVGSDPGDADHIALNYPQGIWLDSNGDVYFSDQSNRIIRRLAAHTGWVTNFASTPKNFNSGSQTLLHAGALVADGNYFYLSDPDANCVWRISRRDGAVDLYAGLAPEQNSPARGNAPGHLDAPSGLTLDSAGNLYIAQGYPGRKGSIIRVDAATRAVTTILSDLQQPSGLAFSSPGVLCFSEYSGNQVRCLDLQSRSIRVVAGTGQAGFSGDGGPAECAQLNRPSGISFDNRSNLYIADTGNQRIRRVRLSAHPDACHSQ
jgi:sugar lactone lactonase YvrE